MYAACREIGLQCAVGQLGRFARAKPPARTVYFTADESPRWPIAARENGHEREGPHNGGAAGRTGSATDNRERTGDGAGAALAVRQS